MHLGTRVGVRRRRGRAAAFACQEHSSALGRGVVLCAKRSSEPLGSDRIRPLSRRGRSCSAGPSLAQCRVGRTAGAALAGYPSKLLPRVPSAARTTEAFKRGDVLRRAGRIDDAIRAFDELVDRYDRYEGEGAVYVQRSVVAALAFKAEAYRNARQWDRELEVMDELLTRFAKSTDLDIRRRVAFTLGRKGGMLRKTGRGVEARAVWLSMLDHFQAGESPEIDESLQQVRAALTRMDRPLPARVVTGALRPVLRRLTR